MRPARDWNKGRLSTSDQNIAIVERIFEGLNSGDLGILAVLRGELELARRSL